MSRRPWPLVFALLLFAAPVMADDAAVVAAYHKLTSQEVEGRPATPPPDADHLQRVDVSPVIRSASFGHKTFLLVAGDHYYVEYGRSTNSRKRLYGPFPLAGDAHPPSKSP